MAERDVKMECDLEEGEIPDPGWEHANDQDQNSESVGLVRRAKKQHKGGRETYRKEVRFEETSSYYDRDARPSRNGTEMDSSRPILTYEDDLYEVVDVCESEENLMDNKENQSKTNQDELDDFSIGINVMLSQSKDSRKVKLENTSTGGECKNSNRRSRSSERSQDDTYSRNKSKTIRTMDNKSRKRHHSPDTKHDQAPSPKRSSNKSKHDHYFKSSPGRTTSKRSSHKRHTVTSVSDHRKNKTYKRSEASSGTKHHSSRENTKRCTKSSSPILLENGKRVGSQIREGLPTLDEEPYQRSYSPISERSLSPCQGSNVRNVENDSPKDIRGNNSFAKDVPVHLNQLKLYTVTAFTPTERKRTIAVCIYKMLVCHLSGCTKMYLTPHEVKDMLNKNPSNPVHFQSDELLIELIKQNADLFVSKFIGDSLRIWPKTDVKICPIFTNNPRLRHQCNDLHICKFYMLSNCEERNCKFGHVLFNSHNRNILKHYDLDILNEFQILRLMQTKESRNISTLPLICKFYNNEGGCSRSSCKHLHLCKYFVKGECKFANRCKRTHSICKGQALDVLRKYFLFPMCEEDATIIQLIVKTLEDGSVKLKREITKGTELSTANNHYTNQIGEDNRSTETCTLDTGFTSRKAGGQRRSETTDFIPLETTDENVDTDVSVDPDTRLVVRKFPDNIQHNDKIKNEITDDNITETMAETCIESTPLYIDSLESNSTMPKSNVNVNVISSTGDSECRHKSEIQSDGISASRDEFTRAETVIVVTEDSSPCNNHIEEEGKEIQLTEIVKNEKSIQKNTFEQHRIYSLTEVNVEATLLESGLCSDEPFSAKPYNAANVTPSVACILPAWTPLKSTFPQDLQNATDVHCRDKCEGFASSGGDHSRDGLDSGTELEPKTNEEDIAYTKAALAVDESAIHVEESTCNKPDTSTRHDTSVISSTQSYNSYHNKKMETNDENEYIANKCNGRDNDCNENSWNVNGNEHNASSGIDLGNECLANIGNIDNECDESSGNGNDNECSTYSANEMDSECIADNGIDNDNECITDNGDRMASECIADSGNEIGNECVADNGYVKDNEDMADSGLGIENEGIADCGNGIDNKCIADSGDGIDNESNTNSGTACVANDDDWSDSVEYSVEYKRNNATQNIRFRHDSVKWQIATSSGMWKDLDPVDKDTMNNVASIVERYALDN